MIYYMTSMNMGWVYWERCRAATLIGAKREATAEYGGGYLDATLYIAVGDNVTAPREVIARKSNDWRGRWVNQD